MDFSDSHEEAAFRAEVREWLATNANPFCIDTRSLLLEELARRGRDWQAHKAAAGYGALVLPREHGGRQATAMQEVIFAEEESRYELPVGIFTSIGINLVLPTLLAHGTQEQINRFITGTIRGQLQWCQLFSEPAAGSDLAGVRARASRVGEEWVINGQKVWNSWAHTADWGVLIARTDPGQTKHQGISYFVVDMKSAGIEVRPIQQISGESEFNEVFFTDVRIPDTQRIGPVNGGWKVAMTTLMNERATTSAESAALPDTRNLLAAMRSAGTSGEDAAAVTLAAARLITLEMGLRGWRLRQLTQLSRGKTLGAEAALGKLVLGKMLQDLSALTLDLHGLAGLFPDEDIQREASKLEYGYCWGAALRIAGGADEVLRNQLAERVLGLPADLRVDKGLSFNQIPTGR